MASASLYGLEGMLAGAPTGGVPSLESATAAAAATVAAAAAAVAAHTASTAASSSASSSAADEASELLEYADSLASVVADTSASSESAAAAAATPGGRRRSKSATTSRRSSSGGLMYAKRELRWGMPSCDAQPGSSLIALSFTFLPPSPHTSSFTPRWSCGVSMPLLVFRRFWVAMGDIHSSSSRHTA